MAIWATNPDSRKAFIILTLRYSYSEYMNAEGHKRTNRGTYLSAPIIYLPLICFFRRSRPPEGFRPHQSTAWDSYLYSKLYSNRIYSLPQPQSTNHPEKDMRVNQLR